MSDLTQQSPARHRPSENNVLVRTVGLTKMYPDGHVQALAGVNLTIHRGEYLALMGPSGSGKSTLLNALGALDVPSGGEVIFDGRRLNALENLDAFRARTIGFVFQSFFLLPTLTAAENVQIPMFETSLSPSQRAAKARQLLEQVHLGHRADHLPSRLSVGERQRAAIARSLANDPLLLLADEPTGNLDSHTAGEVLDLFARLHAEREMTLVVITHSREVAERAQRIVELRDGQIIADEPTGNAR